MAKSKCKIKLPLHYSDLEIPVYNWNNIKKTGDLSWLLLSKKKLRKSDEKLLVKVRDQIENELIKEFGLPDTFISIKQKEIDIAMMRMESITEDDPSLLTFIEIAEIELKDMIAGLASGDFMRTVTLLEKQLKFQIDLHKTSIHKFYSYLKNLN